MATRGSAVLRRRGAALYGELAGDLTDRIQHGEFAPGAKLPPEKELAEAYGVNRLTVRRALSELARSNVIRTEHGVGSFVREASVRHRIDDSHAGLAESMAARGLTVTHELLESSRVWLRDLDADTRSRVPRGWKPPLARFRFRRLLDGPPWSLSTVLMPVGVAPADWDGVNSLTSVLADQGLPVIRAERGFSAAAADDETARWLDIAPGTPVLVVNGINTDHHGVPVMLLQHHTRADRAEYVIRLTEQLEGEE
ncbi:GntR family transcriptional regulator [Kribbella solani]|uniref:DNA-binding GntR family transcriptional regulator n=1 Tax=Kribbella solani TaxID=236067 RepID=A0A841DLH3_9ACTN|nr:GntR family transcriptional regulator [Kribbella solani]MBB5979954.1 DNA-binding GntR family transcriptional regulator [Kribbella solani]